MSENIMYKNIADKMKQESLETIRDSYDETIPKQEFERSLKYIEDYIANLQQENENNIKMLNDIIKEQDMRLNDLQQENERLEINLGLKMFIKHTELNFCKLEDELEDYKSRCEKAVEYIKKDTRWFDSEYAKVYGELCSCAGANANRLEILVNPSNLLNILNGRSDK